MLFVPFFLMKKGISQSIPIGSNMEEDNLRTAQIFGYKDIRSFTIKPLINIYANNIDSLKS